MSWSWEALDLAGVNRAVVVPRSATVTRRLLKPSVLSVAVDGTGAAELGTSARVLRGWRRPAAGGARVLRATGRAAGITAAASTDALEVVTVPAVDALGHLANRVVVASATYTQQTPWFIAADLVADQDARSPTGLAVPEAVSGPPRDRTYEFGKNVAEAVQQLAEVDDGFYYVVDPQDDPAAYSVLTILYPAAGGHAAGAKFEWGDGTIGNLSGLEADLLPPVNSVTAFGAGSGDDQLRVTVVDQPSIDEHGLFDKTISHSDVTELATLEQHALDALRPHERRTFRVTVGAPTDADLQVPTPWEDFDVGDTVALELRGDSPMLTYSDRIMVTSFTVAIDENGTERLAGLDFQADA